MTVLLQQLLVWEEGWRAGSGLLRSPVMRSVGERRSGLGVPAIGLLLAGRPVFCRETQESSEQRTVSFFR